MLISGLAAGGGKVTFWLWGPKGQGKYVSFQQDGKFPVYRIADPGSFFRILRWIVEILVTFPNLTPANVRTYSEFTWINLVSSIFNAHLGRNVEHGENFHKAKES